MSNTCPACQPGKLKKPARVGGATFGVGVAERLVIEAAQRLYENEGERKAMSREQFREEEAKRRKLWDMIHGELDAQNTAPRDAARYRYLRERDLETIHLGGVFAGMTPENVVLNGEDLDQAVDAGLAGRHHEHAAEFRAERARKEQAA